jgi:hypothetical protein
MKRMPKESRPAGHSGRLRIGDHWNAITIIALSQSNPLKAVAEFVENSIDAHARNITIVRGREKGSTFLRIVDDGEGIVRNEDGVPDFTHVATHICDSLKRQLKAQGSTGIQGEFGIGLLSFWTVGEELSLVSTGADGKTYEMRMIKGDPHYLVAQRRRLVASPGTELTVWRLLAGIRHFSGEKLQWYLASELRDRIRHSGVHIRVIDRLTRSEFTVEPREFSGRLLHHLPVLSTAHGEVYVELYLAEPNPENHVGLYRSGTRVVENLAELETFDGAPWTSTYLEGVIDAPFLNLTPGTRQGVVRDQQFADFCQALQSLSEALTEIIRQQRQAEEEQANRDTLRSIQRAFREALLTLPSEEYDWFEIYGVNGQSARRRAVRPGVSVEDAKKVEEAQPVVESPQQLAFFEHPGPLFSVRISPASSVVPVGQTRNLRAVPRDRSARQVEDNLTYQWELADGEGTLADTDHEIVSFTTPAEPGLTRVRLTVTQGDTVCSAEALLTVTDSLLPDKPESKSGDRGLPEYTFEKAPGKLWRSRFDTEQNVIVINSGHRDFVYASRNRSLKLRYICRLFAKELVFHNFPGYSPDQLLERMIELSLYTEENLR